MSTLSNWSGFETAKYTDGALHVANVGVSGSVNTYTVVANNADGSGDGANEFITSATGWKYAKVVPISDVVIAADEALMVCWSTTASAQASLDDVLTALKTALLTPDSAGHANTLVTSNINDPLVITWDGTTTIKTISVASMGGTYECAIITVA